MVSKKVLTMSEGLEVFQMMEEDVLKFLVEGTHLGVVHLEFQMAQHVYKRQSDGVYVINMKKILHRLWRI